MLTDRHKLSGDKSIQLTVLYCTPNCIISRPCDLNVTARGYARILFSDILLLELRKRFCTAINSSYHPLPLREQHAGCLSQGIFPPPLCSDIERIQAGIGDKVAVFLQYFSTFLAGYTVAFAFNWKLALVVASVLPVIAFLSAIIAKVKHGEFAVHYN